MSSFVAKASCNGNRPNSLLAIRYYPRQRLVNRLLENRSVARFVVAPHGYGKTCLILDYAETMYSLRGVFWVNCQSPCFVRDLDNHDLVTPCLERDTKTRLVVFEDLPRLDEARARSFLSEIDQLLGTGVETVISCEPAHDSLVFGDVARMLVTASDLMLDDSELSIGRGGEPNEFAKRASVTPACRVPALAWGLEDNAVRDFLSRTFNEDVPESFALVMALVAVMGSGSRHDLVAVGAPMGPDDAKLAASYPHLGFDGEQAGFEAPRYDISDVAFALRRPMDGLVRASGCANREELANRLAQRLADAGRMDRACDVMRTLCPLAQRISWIDAHAYDLVTRYSFHAALNLTRSLRARDLTVRQRALTAVLEAFCLCRLGAPEDAVRRAKRFAFETAAPADLRAIALVIVAEHAPVTVSAKAAAMLDGLASNPGDADGGLHVPWHAAIAQAWVARAAGTDELFAFWEHAKAEDAHEDALCLVASWFYTSYAQDDQLKGSSVEPLATSSFGAVERYVREQIEGAEAGGVSYFAISAGLAMEEAHMRGMRYSEGPLSTATLVMLRNAEMSLMVQRGRFERDAFQESLLKDDWVRTHPDDALDLNRMAESNALKLSVPKLSVKVFGRLEVRVGSRLVDPCRLGSKHVRALLVLLAGSIGREVSRDAICEAMWPEASIATARKNFYNVWSKLRRALSLPDATCPYLLRHRAGCSFDPVLVQTDVSRLDVICRQLMFEDVSPNLWSDLLDEIDRDFSGELMPSELSNHLVVRLRDDYRNKLVDALVAASDGMLKTGNHRKALWCAQMALSHDDLREDAYVALMRSQIAAGQRTQAMATFGECRAVLAERLGIDPSAEITKLYLSLLDSDEP